MDTYARIKQHETRIAALEAPDVPSSTVTREDYDEYNRRGEALNQHDAQLTELRFDLNQALDRLLAAELRLDDIVQRVADGLEGWTPGVDEEESE